MSDNFKYVQSQVAYLSGSGAVATAVTVTLTSLKQIDGTTNLTMTDFGTIGYGTLEPNNGTQEEQISFTGITQNANGTATLTGVSTVLFVSPYTKTSGLAKNHPGGVKFIISNTAAFYDSLSGKDDDETITGLWTFPDDPNRPRVPTDTDTVTANAFVTLGQLSRQAISGASNAATTVKGIVQLPNQYQIDNKATTGGTGALLSVTPDKLRATKYNDYVADTGAVNAYAIAPTPVVTVYAAGQHFIFKAIHTNTGASTLAVNGLSAIPLKKNKNIALVGGDITTNYIAGVIYDGVNFQMTSVYEPKVSIDGREVYIADSGSANAYVATLVPPASAYVAGLAVRFKATNANTAASTLNVNGLGAKNLITPAGVAITTNYITAGQIVQSVYDGTAFQVQTPPGYRQSILLAQSGAQTTLSGASLTSEQTICQVTVPGGTLSTNRAVRVKMPIEALQMPTAGTFTLKLYYGSTAIATFAADISAPGNFNSTGTGGYIEGYIFANAATNAQRGTLQTFIANAQYLSATITAHIFDYRTGTAAVDSTANQVVKLTAQWSATNANNTLIYDGYVIEIL